MCLNFSTLILVAVARKKDQGLSSSIICKHTHTHILYLHTQQSYAAIYIYYKKRFLNLFQMVYATLDGLISHAMSFMKILLVVKKPQCNMTMEALLPSSVLWSVQSLVCKRTGPKEIKAIQGFLPSPGWKSYT